FVEALVPDPKKTIISWDTELKGFGIIVLPSGRLTYCLQYRNKERIKKRIKIGVHGQITAEEACVIARKYLSMITQGEDPAEQKKALKHLPDIHELAKDYVDRYGKNKRPRSLEEDQKLLRNHIIPKLGDRKVSHLSRRDVENFHAALKETPYQANRTLALLSKMISLAIAWGWRVDNPVKGIPRFPEEKRDRWLNKEEISRLWKTLDDYKRPSSFFFKLLLLTGARKNELLKATWNHFDLEQGVWTKPSSLTKQKKREYLPLSQEAIQVLQELKNLNIESSYVFPGLTKKEPLKDVQNLWKRVIKKADLLGVRIHDLRHTHASHLVSSGLSLSIVGKLLGHTQASTTQRYAHLADEPLRHATSLFGSTIRAVTSSSLKQLPK
ncbi:MAG: tyrosine-type recombinase/integrase, partial [Proteobacteria bacterium]|nr:tyrosine-type recombinase/integrase [Pseudomonadota bacterium]